MVVKTSKVEKTPPPQKRRRCFLKTENLLVNPQKR
jgi:hypothetical protein